MDVCMYEFMHVNMYIMYVSTYFCMYMCMYVCMCVCMLTLMSWIYPRHKYRNSRQNQDIVSKIQDKT